jgi:hypothetical protein
MQSKHISVTSGTTEDVLIDQKALDPKAEGFLDGKPHRRQQLKTRPKPGVSADAWHSLPAVITTGEQIFIFD